MIIVPDFAKSSSKNRSVYLVDMLRAENGASQVFSFKKNAVLTKTKLKGQNLPARQKICFLANATVKWIVVWENKVQDIKLKKKLTSIKESAKSIVFSHYFVLLVKVSIFLALQISCVIPSTSIEQQTYYMGSYALHFGLFY